MLNSSQLQGRLTADPELRYTPAGVAITSFTLASDTGRKNANGDRITNFIDCVAWRGKAEFASKYLKKGRTVIVEGELSTRRYEDRDGNARKATEITVAEIHFCDSKKDSQDNEQTDHRAGDFVPGDDDVPPESDEDLPF